MNLRVYLWHRPESLSQQQRCSWRRLCYSSGDRLYDTARVHAEPSLRTSNAASRSSSPAFEAAWRLFVWPEVLSHPTASFCCRYCMRVFAMSEVHWACDRLKLVLPSASSDGPIFILRAAPRLELPPRTTRVTVTIYCTRTLLVWPAPSTQPRALLVCRTNNLSTSIAYDCIIIIN